MAELLDRIRSELGDRMALLRPSVEEHARLQRACDALDGSTSPAAPAVTPAPVSRAAPRAGRAKPAARRRKAGTRAKPGETQLRVIEHLRTGPGSTSTTVATALGISANAAAATISRLVKQGRVQRLGTGGYAPAEAPPAGAPPPPASAAAADGTA